MPRAGWVKPQSDQHLSDHISIGVLSRTYPPELVDRVLAECGRLEQRRRLLLARVMVCYAMALSLFSEDSYEEVMRNLVEGLDWSAGWEGGWKVPSRVAIAKARARLGPEPLRGLYEEVARPLATARSEGAFCAELRLMAIDGMTLDLAVTEANDQEFGRHGSSRGEGRAAYPQMRAVGLAECGTHAISDVAIGPIKTSEHVLARASCGARSSPGTPARRPRLLGLSGMAGGALKRRRASVAGPLKPDLGGRGGPRGRLLPLADLPLDRPQAHQPGRGARDRVRAGRSRPGKLRALPARDHDHRPDPSLRRRTRRRLPQPLGV